MKQRPLWQRLVTVLLIIATGWYLGAAVTGNWQEVRTFEWNVDPVLLIFSVAAHVAVLAWGVFVWSRLLRSFGHPEVGFLALLRIWFLSNLARYVPGKIWQFLAVAQLGRDAGLSGASLLTSLLIHAAFSLLGAVILVAFTLAEDLLSGGPPFFFPALATVISLVLVHPAVLNTILGIVPRLLRREVVRWTAGWVGGIELLALSVLSWILYGGAFYLFVASLADVSPATIPMLSGVNALSFLAGYVAVIAPAGIGVREVAMANLLLPLLPGAVAAVLAVAARLWTVAAELIGGGITLLLVRKPMEVPNPPAV